MSGEITWSLEVSTTALGAAISPSQPLESNAIASVAACRIARVSCLAIWSRTHRPCSPSVDRGANTAIIAALRRGSGAICAARVSRRIALPPAVEEKLWAVAHKTRPRIISGVTPREKLRDQPAQRIADHD